MSRKTAPGVLKGPVLPYLLRQTLILFLGLVCLASLSLVDVYFIGRLGPAALTAVGFSTPVFLLGFNVLLSLGTGVTATLSRILGGDTEKLPGYLRGGLGLGLITGAGLGLLGWLSYDLLFAALGAESSIRELLKPFMYVLFLGYPVMGLLIAGLSAIRAYGAAQRPAWIMLMIVGLNIVLDPLCIFGAGPIPAMGIVGAAWATFIALLGGTIWTFWELGASPWRSTYLKGIREMVQIALPSAGTRLLLPLSGTIITGMLAAFGPAAVAAYGIGYRIDVTLLMFLIALSSVMAPFAGQNYGAGNIRRLQEGFRLAMIITLVYGLVLVCILVSGHDWVGKRFSEDADILEVLGLYFLILPWGYASNGLLMLSNALLNVLHRPRRAALLGLIHTFGIYLPLAWIALQYQSLPGLLGAYPISLLLASGLGYYWARKAIRAAGEAVHS